MEQLQNNGGILEGLEESIRYMLQESKEPEYTAYLQKMQERAGQQKQQVGLLKAELDRSYQMYLRRMQVQEMPKEGNVQAEENLYAPVQPVQEKSAPERPAPVQKKRNTEFTVGAAVLSIVGGGFILAALVTLGMTFMGGVFKGICLYGISLAFLLVSELYLYRKWPMLGATFSSIGIGGLYLSTAVNYLGLHNFNVLATLCITLVVTILVILLSRKRESVLYRVIGMIAGYLCFLTIGEGSTDTEILVATGLILLMNLLNILLPVRIAKTGINIMHMLVNTFFAMIFLLKVTVGCEAEQTVALIFVITSVIIMQALFVVQFIAYKKENRKACYVGFLTAYYFSMFSYLAMVCLLVRDMAVPNIFDWYGYGSAVMLGIIGLVSIMILLLFQCSGQGHIYTFLNLLVYFLVGGAGGEWKDVICLLIMLVIVKLLCWQVKERVYRINDIFLTLALCSAVLAVDAPQAYVCVVGVLVSIGLMRYWHTFYEMLLTFTLVFYTANHLPDMLQLPAVVGILLVGILLYNNVKNWQGKGILVYNISALIGQAICFLHLSSSAYEGQYITYLCMLVFGLATIILTLQEKYRMDCKGKYLILAGFLTYMAFILRTDIPVVNSVLLMAIALGCVGVGFALHKKSVRIYGLVLSLVVCGKLVLYDFFEAASVQKMILFFTVGAIALIIAAIYIVLEKKNHSEE